eukprot:scaffold95380_cov32-Tisochrysis_lutea.AAC.1
MDGRMSFESSAVSSTVSQADPSTSRDGYFMPDDERKEEQGAAGDGSEPDLEGSSNSGSEDEEGSQGQSSSSEGESEGEQGAGTSGASEDSGECCLAVDCNTLLQLDPASRTGCPLVCPHPPFP